MRIVSAAAMHVLRPECKGKQAKMTERNLVFLAECAIARSKEPVLDFAVLVHEKCFAAVMTSPHNLCIAKGQ